MTLIQRITAAWQVLTGRTLPTALHDEEILTIRRELAAARLQAQELEKQLGSIRNQLAIAEKTRQEHIRQSTAAQLESLFSRLAAPLAQLILQDALLQQGQQVAARDVMVLARQFAEAVQQAGLQPIGSVGEIKPFDPEWAQPLATGVALNAGEEVVIRFIGYRFGDQVLRKALVERRV